MGKYEFVLERSNKHKREVFVATVMIVVVISAIFVVMMTFFREGFTTSSSYTAVKEFFNKDIKAMTPVGLFYMSLFGNLLFIPLPVEIPFYLGLGKGNPFWTSLFLVVAGMIPAYAFDYYVGTKFSKIIFTFISTKKIYKAKRVVNKWGGLSIFLFNVSLMPANELTFALGIAKYNVVRLFFYTITGSLIKFSAIYGFYYFFVHI